MRTPNASTASFRWAMAAGLAACLASSAPAQSPHVGARLGIDFESKDLLVSTQATIPVTSMLDFYPSIDVYLPEEGTQTGFNGDVRFRLPTNQGPDLYVGGGMNVLLRNIRDESETDVGAKALFGIESRTGWIHPFLEGRLMVNDNSSFQFIGGLNFTIR
jgi:hypothetical protein